MRKRGILLISAIVSFFIHSSLVAVSYFIWVPGVSGVVSETIKLFQVQEIDLTPPPAAERPIAEEYGERLKFQTPSENVEEMIGSGIMKPQKIAQPEDTPLMTEPEMFALEQPAEPPLELESSLPPIKDAPLEPELRSIGKDAAPPAATRPAIDLFQPANPVPPGESKIIIPEEFVPALKGPELPAGGPDLESLPAAEKGNALQGALANIAAEHAFRPTPAYESLDEFLGVSLLTYRDPEDNQGYYQLSIYPKPNAPSLEVMPKEVIFLLDASLSIRYKWLNGFKQGIKNSIQKLNPNDLFNIFVFKNTTQPFARGPVGADADSVYSAGRFLDTITPSQTTNIYAALYNTIQNPPSFDPSYIVLITDGKPTEGIRSTTKLITQITKSDKRRRPIYTFSAGKRVDRFLLDFLAYPNRAWSEHAEDHDDIVGTFNDFYGKIANPILVNVRYQITPLDDTDIYPKHLPDFFRDTMFTLYGKFDDESKFSIRILGNIGDKTKEFIFANDFKNAAEGTRSIARFWAFNKIYHLISKMTLEGPNAAEIAEIERLTKEFKLSLPYDIEDLF